MHIPFPHENFVKYIVRCSPTVMPGSRLSTCLILVPSSALYQLTLPWPQLEYISPSLVSRCLISFSVTPCAEQPERHLRMITYCLISTTTIYTDQHTKQPHSQATPTFISQLWRKIALSPQLQDKIWEWLYSEYIDCGSKTNRGDLNTTS